MKATAARKVLTGVISVFLLAAVALLFAVSAVGASEREPTLGDYYEDGGNFYGGGAVPALGQDVFLFADLPWEDMGISSSTRIPQWVGYGPARWTFMTAPSNQMLLQGKLTDAGLTVVDLIANLVFDISKIAVLIGNVVVICTFHNYAADYLPGLISDCVAALYGSGVPGSGSSEAYPMWQMAVGLALVGLGITVAVHFFKARLVQGLLNYALAVLLLSVLLGYFAEIDAIAAGVNRIMDQGTALVVTGTFDAVISKASGGPADEAFDETLLRITETTWDLLIGRPWALGQWGTYETAGHGPDSLRLSENELQSLQKNAYNDILGGLFEAAGISSSGAQPLEIPARAAYIDKVYLGGNENARSKLLEMVQNRDSIVHIACGQEWMSATRHVEYALLSLVPAVTYAALAVSLGIPVFIAQILMGVMLIFFPLAIVFGLSGDSGRRMLMAYSRSALGLLLTKVVYGLYLALVLALISVFWHIFSASYAITFICTSVLMFYSLKHRRHVMQMALEALSGARTNSADVISRKLQPHRLTWLMPGLYSWSRQRHLKVESGDGESGYGASAAVCEPPPVVQRKGRILSRRIF